MQAESKRMSDPKRGRKDPDGNMPLTGHLRELRNRVIVCLAVLTAAFLVMLAFAGRLVTFLLALGEKYDYRFVYIAPQELLLQYFQTAFVFAIFVSLPVILFELWSFISPGLTKKEKTGCRLVMVFGFLFAGAGILFAYYIMIPFMLRFLGTLNAGTPIASSISVQNYISFLLLIFMIFAAVFELPVAASGLTALGILKAGWMKKGRKIIIVLIFFIAAIITPPDVTSQIMVAIPMIVLFEISILLCSIIEKAQNSRTS